MSDTIKLIIEIPKEDYERCKKRYQRRIDIMSNAIVNGTPLDDVKAKIETDLSWQMYDEYGNETGLHKSLMEILDNIGKSESENK